MTAITPDKIENWKDQMRRFKNVIVPVEDFAAILEIIDGRSHAGCFCPYCNPEI